MSENTKIEWCDSTFNPAIGCKAISPGCKNCYAAALAKRTGRDFDVPTRTKDWSGPVKWNAEPFYACSKCGWRGSLRKVASTGGDIAIAICPTCAEPVNTARRRVFCASMADVFDNQWDPQWRVDLFELIRATPNLDWLLLTKRIGNVEAMVKEAGGWPANAQLGLTVVNQAEANRDIPKALHVKKRLSIRVLFLSAEPLLGPLQLWRLTTYDFEESAEGAEVYPLRGLYAVSDCDWDGPRVDWVIAGGESGPKARPMHPDWVRSLRDQCERAGVHFLFKQWGEWAPRDVHDLSMQGCQRLHLDGSFDGMFSSSDEFVRRVGKKAAGRLLDGIEHNGVPQ